MQWVDIEVPNDSVDRDSQESSACYPWRTFDTLSDGDPTVNHRITRTDTKENPSHLGATCRSSRQGGIYPCAPQPRYPAWAPLRTPPLHFGRRPPQSNWQPSTVRVVNPWGVKRRGGWCFIVASFSQRLNILGAPPTLYTAHFAPMERSSEGAQGLPV